MSTFGLLDPDIEVNSIEKAGSNNSQTPYPRKSGAAEKILTPAGKEARATELRPLSEYQEVAVIDLVRAMNWAEARSKIIYYKSQTIVEGDLIDKLEKIAFEQIRPIPATKFAENAEGYKFLSFLAPNKSDYSKKAQDYQSKQRDAESSARNAIISMMKTKVDKVENITWYQHPNQPRHTNSRSTAYIYIGKMEARQPWLRMKIQYASNNWLFVNRVEAWYDGKKETLFTGEFSRDNHTTIWEWVDVTPNQYQLEVLRSIASSNKAILRFHGTQYRRDVTLSSGDKRLIREVLEAFEAMKR